MTHQYDAHIQDYVFYQRIKITKDPNNPNQLNVEFSALWSGVNLHTAGEIEAEVERLARRALEPKSDTKTSPSQAK